MATSLKDRIFADYSSLLDSFTNLIKSARVPEEQPAELGRAQGGKVPGELMEVFVEKLLQSAGALLAAVAELKRNALLNDFAARNAEVEAARGEHRALVQELEARCQHVQLQIQQVLAQQQGALQPGQHGEQQPGGGQPLLEDLMDEEI